MMNFMHKNSVAGAHAGGLDAFTPFMMDDLDMEKARRDDPSEVRFVYCIVFPNTPTKKMTEEEMEETREGILRSLEEAGFSTQLFYSVQRTEIFCKVGATDGRYLDEADIAEYKLELDPNAVQHVLESDADMPDREPIFLGYPYRDASVYDRIRHEFKKPALAGFGEGMIRMAPSEVTPYIREQTSYSPFEQLHARYNDEWEEKIVRKHSAQIYRRYNDGTILRTADRIKLAKLIMQRGTQKDPVHSRQGAGLNLGKLAYEKKIKAYFPLQLSTNSQKAGDLTVDQLFTKWSSTWYTPWVQPIEDIRDYAGEKIALYFAFLGHYTFWLLLPSLVGFAVFCHQLYVIYDATGSFNFVTLNSRLITEPPLEAFNRSSFVEVFDDGLANATDFNLTTEVYTEVPESPYFALFISFWSTFLLEFWKRKQARLALFWGTSDYEQTAIYRVEFKPSHIVPSPVTGLPEPYRSPRWFAVKLSISLSIVGFAVVVVLATVGAILILKVVMSNYTNVDPLIAPQIALAVNAVAIILLQNVYKTVAKLLNDWENHRTDIEYEDMLVGKTFVFSFVNSYSTLAYFAFLKSGNDILSITQFCIAELEEFSDNPQAKEVDKCFGGLTYSLFIIFFSQIVVNNTTEIVLPVVMSKLNQYLSFRSFAKQAMAAVEDAADAGEGALRKGIDISKNTAMKAATVVLQTDDDDEDEGEKPELSKAVMSRKELREMTKQRERTKSPSENQFYLRRYETPFEDYLEIAIQFGYVSLFVAAFPLAPLLALINNMLEFRVDSYKVCVLSRRPEQPTAADIGTWQGIFTIMAYLAVVSNAGVICFTSEVLASYDDVTRVWLFILFVVTVVGTKALADFFITDVPQEVTIQLARQKYITRKILVGVPDDKVLEEGSFRDLNEEGGAPNHEIAETDPLIDIMLAQTSRYIRERFDGEDPSTIFDRADLNENQELSLKELAALLADVGGLADFMSPYEIRTMVNSMDINGDGTISREEFDRFLNSVNPDDIDINGPA